MDPGTRCGRCGQTIHGSVFIVTDGFADQPLALCWRDAVRHPPWLKHALHTALVVGTLLALINHGGAYWSQSLSVTLAAQTVLTYCVPFGVSMWGALMASRRPPQRGGPDAHHLPTIPPSEPSDG
jgi:hypothetical protein